MRAPYIHLARLDEVKPHESLEIHTLLEQNAELASTYGQHAEALGQQFHGIYQHPNGPAWALLLDSTQQHGNPDFEMTGNRAYRVSEILPGGQVYTDGRTTCFHPKMAASILAGWQDGSLRFPKHQATVVLAVRLWSKWHPDTHRDWQDGIRYLRDGGPIKADWLERARLAIEANLATLNPTLAGITA
jgi:hypothetical protein